MSHSKFGFLETQKACEKKTASTILENAYALSIILFAYNSSWYRRNSATASISSLFDSSRKVAEIQTRSKNLQIRKIVILHPDKALFS